MIAALWARIAPYVLGAGVILAAIATFGMSQRRAGYTAAKTEQKDQTIKAAEIRHDVEDTVRRTGAGAADELREHWSRD